MAEMGLDSLMGIELKNAIEAELDFRSNPSASPADRARLYRKQANKVDREPNKKAPFV
ncbi:acyl carrier protein [Bremerella sp. JC817]|uniref:acyl carrier protein n=1 Tax=Bremerella sp. JC817 TaxID=3231756 RepID=UPI003457B1A2